MKVDNFTLEQFQCPAKYDLRIRQSIVPLRRKPSLSFGAAVHLGLAEWYRNINTEPEIIKREAKALQLMHKHWPEVMPSDDFRTEAYAMKVIHDYVKEYPSENWKVLQGLEGGIVEQAFTLDTGIFLECAECECYSSIDDMFDGICSNCSQPLEPIQYGGIIDVGCEFGDTLYVVDHKTTTRLGDGGYYFLQYKPDNQMTGYIWALGKLTNRRVGGAIVNAIGLYKGGDVKFKRHITSRNQFDIDEWLIGVREKCNAIKKCERTGIWPMNTGQCMNYGECEYHSIHVLSGREERSKRIEQDYVKSTWNYEDRED